MNTSQHFPSDQPETPATFQRLAPVRERLVTAYLPSVLDEPCQTWYRHTVTRYLAQQLLTLYRRRIVQVVEEQGHDALPRRTVVYLHTADNYHRLTRPTFTGA